MPMQILLEKFLFSYLHARRYYLLEVFFLLPWQTLDITPINNLLVALIIPEALTPSKNKLSNYNLLFPEDEDLYSLTNQKHFLLGVT